MSKKKGWFSPPKQIQTVIGFHSFPLRPNLVPTLEPGSPLLSPRRLHLRLEALPHWRLQGDEVAKRAWCPRESQGDPTLPSRASEARARLGLISFLVLVGLFLESQRMSSGCKRCLLVHRCLILFIGSKDGWQGLPQRPEEEEHSADWREGAACPWWTGKHRAGWWKGCGGHRWFMQFLLSIPGSKDNRA